MNPASRTHLLICRESRPLPAVVLLVTALLAATTQARGGSRKDSEKPKISHVFFAQHHVQTPDSPYFKLVGNLEALVKVHLSGKRGLPSPEVLVRLGLGSKTLSLELEGPKQLAGPVTGNAAVMKHTYDDSFTSLIPKEWIAPGLRMQIEVRQRTSSKNGRGLLRDRKTLSGLNIGAPMRLIMTMFDFHFFGRAKGADYPRGWFEELGSKLPVAELELRRVRNINFDKLVMPPQADGPAVICGDRAEYQKKTGKRFDGEQGVASRWNGALKQAAGAGWGGTRRLYYSNIYGVHSGGQGGGLSGVGNGTSPGILLHELGHTLGLPHWAGKKQYPYIGDMYGISSPNGSDFPHAGPVWAFDLVRRRFISPVKDGRFKRDPMQGGGAGDRNPYLFKHFSDYSVSRMRGTLEKTQVVWNRRAGSYMVWNQGTGSYSVTARRRGSPTVPVEHDIEVISVLASASLVTGEANIVYPPIGPYTAGRIETFDASDPRGRFRAREAGFEDSNCSTCLRVTQGKKVTIYLIKDGLAPTDDPKKSDSLAVFAINLPARNGEVTQVDLLYTPGVLSRAGAKKIHVLYSWKTAPQATRTEAVTAIYGARSKDAPVAAEAAPPTDPRQHADGAAKAWAALTTKDKQSLTTLGRFIERWAGTPAADKAAELRISLGNSKGSSELERLCKGRPSPAAYARFLKRWKGLPIAEVALARFDAKGAELLAKIDTGTPAQRALSLLYFARMWSVLPVAEKATRRRNAIAAKLLQDIQALTDKRLRTKRLAEFNRTYRDTPSVSGTETKTD